MHINKYKFQLTGVLKDVSQQGVPENKISTFHIKRKKWCLGTKAPSDLIKRHSGYQVLCLEVLKEKINEIPLVWGDHTACKSRILFLLQGILFSRQKKAQGGAWNGERGACRTHPNKGKTDGKANVSHLV